jgi:hypothetical protein
MIFVAQNKIILEPNFCLVLLKCTSGEFIMILSLIEIFIPDLCLIIIINV